MLPTKTFELQWSKQNPWINVRANLMVAHENALWHCWSASDIIWQCTTQSSSFFGRTTTHQPCELNETPWNTLTLLLLLLASFPNWEEKNQSCLKVQSKEPLLLSLFNATITIHSIPRTWHFTKLINNLFLRHIVRRVASRQSGLQCCSWCRDMFIEIESFSSSHGAQNKSHWSIWILIWALNGGSWFYQALIFCWVVALCRSLLSFMHHVKRNWTKCRQTRLFTAKLCATGDCQSSFASKGIGKLFSLTRKVPKGPCEL